MFSLEVIFAFILAKTSAGAISGLIKLDEEFFKNRNAITAPAKVAVTVDGRRPNASAMDLIMNLVTRVAPIRSVPRIETCAIRSIHFRLATCLKVKSSLWSIDMMFGAKSFGLILLKMESKMIGIMNVIIPKVPGRSNIREIRTNVSESLALRRENS